MSKHYSSDQALGAQGPVAPPKFIPKDEVTKPQNRLARVSLLKGQNTKKDELPKEA